MKHKKSKNILGTSLLYLELIIMSIIVLIPIAWIVGSAFNPSTSLASSTLIPKEFTLENFKKLFIETNYLKWTMNTFMIASLNTVVSLMLIMITAWIVSRFNFKGKKIGLLTLMLLSMFPSFLAMTAIYTLFLTFGLLDNPLALVIIYSAGAIPYNVWLVKGYLDDVPKSIDEAAYIDGCSKFQTFFKIILPLSKPIITYAAVSQFMLPWMDYILPNLLLSSDENKTLAVGLYSFISNSTQPNYTMFAAGAVLVSIPITLVYIAFQKNITEGITAGADK